MRPMFGAFGRAPRSISIAWVSQACNDQGAANTYGLNKRIEPVRACRKIGKRDMKLNDATPEITVDPETYRVTADGEHLTCQPAKKLALAQRYFLF
jgi:urease subunit alpha